MLEEHPSRPLSLAIPAPLSPYSSEARYRMNQHQTQSVATTMKTIAGAQ